MKQPRLQPHFQAEILPPDHVYLLSEESSIVLKGNLYSKLTPLLDGNHSVSEIINQLKGEFPLTSIYYALQTLKRKGYTTEAVDHLSPNIAAFWSLLNIDPQLFYKLLPDTGVSVTSVGDVPTEPLIVILKSLGIQVQDSTSDIPDFKKSLTVVLTNDYLQPTLAQFNQIALETNQPWILVKPVGMTLWLGPIFYPNKTGCWQCLAQRLYGNREVETAIKQQKGSFESIPTSLAILPSTFQLGLNWAATEILKWIILDGAARTSSIPTLEGNVLTLNLANLEQRIHRLTKRPQCSVCGDAIYQEERQPKPITLMSCQKQFTADGGHRVLSPEQTLKRYEHHLSPITGVVSALVRTSESENNLLHSYLAVHHFGHATDLTSLRHILHHKAAGKGKTDQQAKASGFCEAIERYCGLFQGDEIRVKRTYAQLGDLAIHPSLCLHFSQAQYQNREALNQHLAGIDFIPEPFDETQEIEWTPIWSLTTQRFNYVPTALCYYNYPLPGDHFFGVANSNGNAAGNTLEEAIFQGFMEVVERDSVAIWWYNRLQRPAVDLASFEDSYLLELQTYYLSQGREFWVLDLTSDLEIPVFAAISRCTDGAEKIVAGYGAHFDAKIALLRAVTEMNQFLIRVENQYAGEVGGVLQEWLSVAAIANQPYLAPDSQVAAKVYHDYPQRGSDDLRDDVLTCVAIAEQHNLETLVLDQTRPDIGLNVVKVIVPGLRHFWSRLGAGRLYDVPVTMGWLPAPLVEQQMNPIPMPF
jgi:ribosomal protein S12 methylthiotransferase accessory factor